MNIPAILESLRPGASWTLNGETYDDLLWRDDTQTKPTTQEIKDAWVTVEPASIKDNISRQRNAAYAIETDPLFFRWQAGRGVEQTWLDARAAVQARLPYPTA